MMTAPQTELLRGGCLALSALALLIATYVLFRMRPPPVPALGSRGERRQRALAKEGLFKWAEPTVRQISVWVAVMPFFGWRSFVERRLAEAGYYLGVTADEFIAMQLLSAVSYAAVAAGIGTVIGSPLVFAAIAGPMGFFLLQTQVEEERTRRFREVSRALPVDIDLAAMCMQAGSDFPGAIRLIVGQRNQGEQVLREELVRILQELDLGHTRATALGNFAARMPTPAVREFVSAVIQAEEKGTPLVDVLRIQAGMLRMRRSVLAEEAASRAGVMMVVPMLLLLGCIMILLMAPLMISSNAAAEIMK